MLELYALMKISLQDYLVTIPGQFYITFDGWTNSNYWGFYLAMLHFAKVPMDLFTNPFLVCIEPGPSASVHCASKIFNLLYSFGIADKLLATVTNN